MPTGRKPISYEGDRKKVRDRLKLPDRSQRKEKRGRPTYLTGEVLAKMEVACRTAASLTEISLLIGVDLQTLIKWRQRYPELKREMEMWRAEGRHYAVKKLLKRIKEDDWFALKFYLEKRHGDFGGGGSQDAEAEERDRTNQLPDFAYL